MDILRTVVIAVYLIICIALVVVVMMQEGKQSGLGALTGASDSYWSKNKGRSMEGALEKSTKFLALGFIVISVVLNLNW